MKGMTTAKKRSIKADVMEDPHGEIVADVCAKTITLPKGVFLSSQQSFQLFSDTMKAVINNSLIYSPHVLTFLVRPLCM